MLTKQQQDIVDWARDGSGNALVRARAGTGKTYLLLEIVRVLVALGVKDIAICAYNTAIAKEVAEKVKLPVEDGGLGITDWKLCSARTIHSLGFSAWRYVAKDVKVDQYKVQNILQERNDPIYDDLGDSITQLVSLAKQAAIGHLTGIKDLSAWYDLVEHHAINDTGDYSIDRLVDCAVSVLEESVAQDYKVIDFDDMILAPLIHSCRIWEKKWVMVDEAQDLSTARRCLAKAFAGKHGRMIYVGDDRQAIYGFSGAATDSLDQINISQEFPLTMTFRCGKNIVNFAKRLVPDYEAHENNPDGQVISDEWPTDLGPGDAVISRKNADLLKMAYGYLKNGTACRMEGRSIGTGLIKLATRWKRIKTLPTLSEKIDSYKFKEIEKWTAKEKPAKAEAVEDQCDCLQILIQRVLDLGKDTVEDLASEINAMFSDDVKGVLVLTTAHKSKGREWPRVAIYDWPGLLSCAWDKQPWQVRQSENLAYVAATRAESNLYVC